MEIRNLEIERLGSAKGRKKKPMRFLVKDLKTDEVITETTLREIAFSCCEICKDGRYGLETRLYQARKKNRKVTFEIDGREAYLEWNSR